MRQEFSEIITLEQIKTLLSASDSQGDLLYEISGISTLEHAIHRDISFLINNKYQSLLKTTKAGAILLPQNQLHLYSGNAIVSENPRFDIIKIIKQQLPELINNRLGVHHKAVIGNNCIIASNASIGANCVVGDNCVIGDCSILHASIILYSNVKIGNNCVINSGTVIGSNGFGYARKNSKWHKMPDLGTVEIGDNVQIGANTTIDRGFLGNTVIATGVIIDNQVQIAHNVSIGAHTAIAGCVGIAGSTNIGAHCLIGGGALIAGHIEIADKVHITASSGVSHSLRYAGVYSSSLSARDSITWNKNAARFSSLDRMAKKIKEIETNLVMLQNGERNE